MSSTTGLLQGDSDAGVLFNGSNAIVYNGPAVIITGATVTVEGWYVRNTVGGAIAMNFSQSANPTSGQTGMYCLWGGAFGVTPRSVTFASHGNAAANVTWVDVLPAGPNSDATAVIVHQALVFNDTAHTAELFINGVSQGVKTVAAASLADQGDLRLASWWANSVGQNYPWVGTIDEFTVYSRALTATEILHHYTLGANNPGSFIKRPLKQLGGSLGFAGSITRVVGHGLSGALSFTGNIVKKVAHSLSASLGFSGALTKRTARLLSAALSFTGLLVRQLARALTAMLSFSGQVIKQLARNLTSSLSFAGSVTKVIGHGMSASLSFAGQLQKSTKRNLLAALSFTGNLVRRFPKSFAASLSFAGSVVATMGAVVQVTGKVIALIIENIENALRSKTDSISELRAKENAAGPQVKSNEVTLQQQENVTPMGNAKSTEVTFTNKGDETILRNRGNDDASNA